MRAIPTGYGFGLVSCPNYFFEAIAWGCFTALTLDWAGKSSRFLPPTVELEGKEGMIGWELMVGVNSGIILGRFGRSDVSLGAKET